MYPGIYARIKGFYRYWLVWSPTDRKTYRKYLYERGHDDAVRFVPLAREARRAANAAMRERDARNAAKAAMAKEVANRHTV